MLINRSVFFLAIALLIIIPVTMNKVLWLSNSGITTGVKAFEGMGNALDQMRPTYTVVYFKHRSDTIWFNAPGALDVDEGAAVAVRYSLSDPQDARINSFAGIWAENAIYGGIPVVLLLIIFIHPQVVPYRSRIRLKKSRPFIQMV